MPVYEYQCKACQKAFEYQQRMSDPEKTTCEACGAEQLERLISRTAFTLKGGGWYKDLYSSSKPEPKTSDGTAKADGASSSDSSSSPSASPSSTPSPSSPSSPSSSPSTGSASAPAAAPSTAGGSSSGSGGSTSKSAASGAK